MIAKYDHHNERVVRFLLKKCYPNEEISTEKLIRDNLIDGTKVAELSISKTNDNIELCSSGIGRDLTDDSDVKTITVHEETKKYYYKTNKVRTGREHLGVVHVARVHGIKNKIGKLRVICYNPFFNRWYYLIIPNSVYKSINKIHMSFSKITGDITGKYKQYEVFSWEELCCN